MEGFGEVGRECLWNLMVRSGDVMSKVSIVLKTTFTSASKNLAPLQKETTA